MAGLLAADGIALLQHPLQHVPVAHVGALQLHAVLLHKSVQPQVGHHRGHHCLAGQLALLQHIQTAGGHDLVPVDEVAQLVHRQAPVCVAVKGDADVIAAGLDHGGQGIGVGGAALVVDVHPVGVGVDHVGAQLGEAVKQPGGGGGGRTVGAVHQDAQPTQGGVDGPLQVVDIVLRGLGGHIAHLADVPVGLAGHIVVAEEDDVLDLLLQLVRELKALAVEDLDAVMLEGVVAGGDDDAGVRPLVHRHPGHAGGGQGAQVQHVGPGGTKARNEGALQQVAGDAGVLADGDQGLLPRLLVPCQHLCGGQANLIRQIRVQTGVDHAADAVGPK